MNGISCLIIAADAFIAVTTFVLVTILPYLSDDRDTLLLFFLLLASALRSVGAGIQTPTVSAVIPELVPEEHYMRVNGINATIQSVFHEMRLGIHYARTVSCLRNLLILNGFFIFLCVPVGFLATLYVSRTMGTAMPVLLW